MSNNIFSTDSLHKNKTFNLSALPTSLIVVSPDVKNELGSVLMEAIYILIFVLGIIGNAAMMILLNRRRRRRKESPSNLLLLHVVIAELSVLVFNIPIDVVLIHVGHKWVFGSTMCKILWPAQTLSYGSFVWILTLLSYHRYRGIVHPLASKLSTKKLNRIVAVIWLCSLFVVIPYGLFLDFQDNDCTETWSTFTRKCFTVIFFAVQYAFPLSITMNCYIRIAIVVRKGEENVKNLISGSIQAESRRRKRNLSAVRTAVLFTAIFAVCMLPHQALWLWLEFSHFQGDIRHVLTFAYMFTFTSVFMNPLVYILSTPSVRKEFYRKAKTLHIMASCSNSDRPTSKRETISIGTSIASGESSYV